jgi:hypothetical protein
MKKKVTQEVKTKHLSISIDGVLAMTDEEVEQSYYARDDGTYVTPQEARETAQYYKSKGFEVIPPCDHHDEKGYCLGHPVLHETPQAKAKREIEELLEVSRDNVWQKSKKDGVRMRIGLTSLIVWREQPTNTQFKWMVFNADGEGNLGTGYSPDLGTAKDDALECALLSL